MRLHDRKAWDVDGRVHGGDDAGGDDDDHAIDGKCERKARRSSFPDTRCIPLEHPLTHRQGKGREVSGWYPIVCRLPTWAPEKYAQDSLGQGEGVERTLRQHEAAHSARLGKWGALMDQNLDGAGMTQVLFALGAKASDPKAPRSRCPSSLTGPDRQGSKQKYHVVPPQHLLLALEHLRGCWIESSPVAFAQNRLAAACWFLPRHRQILI